MKKNNNYFAYAMISVVAYWLIFVILPYYVAVNIKKELQTFDLSGYIGMFCLFGAPFFFIIPYFLTIRKIKERRKRKLFMWMGLVIPYLIIYACLYYAITHMGAPHF